MEERSSLNGSDSSQIWNVLQLIRYGWWWFSALLTHTSASLHRRLKRRKRESFQIFITNSILTPISSFVFQLILGNWFSFSVPPISPFFFFPFLNEIVSPMIDATFFGIMFDFFEIRVFSSFLGFGFFFLRFVDLILVFNFITDCRIGFMPLEVGVEISHFLSFLSVLVVALL